MLYMVKQRGTKYLCYLFFITLAVICIVPVYMLLINATRTTPDINRGIGLIPGTNLLVNWQSLTARGINFIRGLFNSSFIAFSTTALSVYFSLLTAYAIKVYNFKFKKQFFIFIVMMTMVPGQLYIIGFFQYVATLNLLNSYIPIIIPSIAAAGTVFFAKQYFDAALIPELIQSARIDGASEMQIFNKIALPLAAPGAFTMGIFAFVGSWNSFLTPFMLLTDQELFTLPLMMAQLNSDPFITDFGMIYTGMSFTIIPVIIVYALFSKNIISGISLGSVKG